MKKKKKKKNHKKKKHKKNEKKKKHTMKRQNWCPASWRSLTTGDPTGPPGHGSGPCKKEEEDNNKLQEKSAGEDEEGRHGTETEEDNAHG